MAATRADARSCVAHNDGRSADRRVYRLSLTPAGRRLVATLEGRIKRVEAELLAPLAAAERAAFVDQLRRILAASDGGAPCDDGGGSARG